MSSIPMNIDFLLPFDLEDYAGPAPSKRRKTNVQSRSKQKWQGSSRQSENHLLLKRKCSRRSPFSKENNEGAINTNREKMSANSNTAPVCLDAMVGFKELLFAAELEDYAGAAPPKQKKINGNSCTNKPKWQVNRHHQIATRKVITEPSDECNKPITRKQLFRIRKSTVEDQKAKYIPPAESRRKNGLRAITNTEGFSDGNCSSPLIDVDKAEILLKKKSVLKDRLFKSPKVVDSFKKIEQIKKTCKSKSNENISVAYSTNEKVIKTQMNHQNESLAEFMENEEHCSTVAQNIQSFSPVDHGYMINNVQGTTSNLSTSKFLQFDERLKEIKQILLEDKMFYDKLEAKQQEFKIQHEKNISRINEILNTFGRNKENYSPDLKLSKTNFGCKKPPLKTINDLRKTVLQRNLKEVEALQEQTPKTKKALDMYNNLRSNYSILSTPKFNQNSLETSKLKNSKNLSSAVQEQCLMLQKGLQF